MEITYSVANFLFIIYVYLYQHYDLIPLCINNSFAISYTWYCYMFIFDISIPFRMMQKHQWSLVFYLIGEFTFHIVPLVFSLHCFSNVNRFAFVDKKYLKHSGIYTLCANLMWSLFMHGGFEPNRAYVDIHSTLWNIIWCINAMAHIGGMYILNDAVL